MLDISTLYVMVALSSIVAGVVHVVPLIGGRFGPWAAWWGVGHLLLGSSALVPMLIDRGAPVALIPIGNVTGVVSYVAIFIGMRTFADPAARNGALIAVAAVIAIPLIFWVDRAQFAGRIAYLAVMRSLFDVATVMVAIRIARRESLHTGWIVAIMFAVTVPMFLARAGLALSGKLGAKATGWHEGPEAWLAAGAIAFIMFRGFSLLTMNAERGERRLAALAERDVLTGAYNRTGFAHARDTWRGNGAVLMIDLDRFKALNDRLGHAAGDAALCLTVTAATASLGRDGWLFRWGGDEFVCVLPGADSDAAAACGRAIDARFAGALPAIVGVDAPVTLSIGRAIGSLLDIDHLIQEADRRMYAEKRHRYASGTSRQRIVAETDPCLRLISQSQHG